MSKEQAFAKVDLLSAELELVGSIYEGFSTAIMVKDQPRTVGLFREYDDAVQMMALIQQAQAAALPRAGETIDPRFPKGRPSTGCYCTTHCAAPRIMGRQTPCLRLPAALTPGEAIKGEA